MHRAINSSLLASVLLVATIVVSPPAAAECVGEMEDLTACVLEPAEDEYTCDTIVEVHAWTIPPSPISPNYLPYGGGANVAQCDEGSICYGGHVYERWGETLVYEWECDGNLPLICDISCEPPTLCEPGIPCLSLTPGDVAQPVTTTANGDPLVTVGGATVTFTTGHFTTVVLAAEGNNAPCSTVIGLPGVANCVANSIVGDQTYYSVTDGVTHIACLKDAWLGVDVNGDGAEETGGPAFFVETGNTNCT